MVGSKAKAGEMGKDIEFVLEWFCCCGDGGLEVSMSSESTSQKFGNGSVIQCFQVQVLRII